MEYFKYSTAETDYLKKKDKKLGLAIDQIGYVKREVYPDLFAALVNSIVAQQISMKAAQTVWERILTLLKEVTPVAVAACTAEALQSCGISFRKVRYIQNAADKVLSGQIDLAALPSMTDQKVCKALTALDGVGVWTAEMLMTFSMQRPDILSYSDFGIRKGLCMLHGHKELTKELFEKYRKRYSPCGTVASLYLWAIAGGLG